MAGFVVGGGGGRRLLALPGVGEGCGTGSEEDGAELFPGDDTPARGAVASGGAVAFGEDGEEDDDQVKGGFLGHFHRYAPFGGLPVAVEAPLAVAAVGKDLFFAGIFEEAAEEGSAVFIVVLFFGEGGVQGFEKGYEGLYGDGLIFGEIV